jgi:cellulose synthase/poly-beta-1,6-N-acetylglucosamine synthase-like glycosyltransferase
MGTLILKTIAIVCIGGVVYSYLVYPLVLCTLAAMRPIRRPQTVARNTDEPLPSIAVIIAAYNEETHIEARIRNLLALDYPAQCVHVFIGSDGSTDRTAEWMARFDDPRVHTYAFAQNRGKASVLNDLVAVADQPLLVFSDANTFFDKGALRALAARFDDPHVGGVSGELRLSGSRGDNQDGAYWRVETFLKRLEDRIGGLLGANGAIYAIRRELWRPLRADTICDDFCVAMNVAARGRRLVYEPAAWAEEDTPDTITDEYRRRVRIGIGNFQALMRHPEYLYRTSPGTAFAYVSHKVLRWIAPHLLLIGLIASLLLGLSSHVWLTFGAIQLAGYLFAAALWNASRQGRSIPRLLRIPAFLFALNWAFLVASVRYATGNYRGAWQRTRRTEETC